MGVDRDIPRTSSAERLGTDMTAAAPGLGDELAGRYQLESELSRSEHATVWKATDLTLARPVVVKLAGPALSRRPLGLTRFARCARAAAAIQHPNITRVLDYSATGRAPYLVLEPSGVHTLAGSTRNRTPRAEEVEGLLLTLRSAVEDLHRHGLVHGAVNAENVLLGAASDVRLTSFGFRRDHLVGGDDRPLASESDLRGLGSMLLEIAGETRLRPQVRRELERLATTPEPVNGTDGQAASSPPRSSRHQRAVDAAIRQRRRLVPGIVAAAAAAAGITLAANSSASPGAHAPHTPPGAQRPSAAIRVELQHHPTLDQRLQSLTSAVQHAAAR